MNSTQQKAFKQLLTVAKRQFSLYNYSDKANPRVFLTLSKNGQPLGDLVFELYKNQAPENVDSFVSFATGHNQWSGSYKGQTLDRGLPGSVIGTGHVWPCESSSNGARLYDENLSLRHYKRGQLTLRNSGDSSNGSAFYITLDKADYLDGYNQLIGELVEGDDVLRQAEETLDRHGSTSAEIKIENSGTR